MFSFLITLSLVKKRTQVKQKEQRFFILFIIHHKKAFLFYSTLQTCFFMIKLRLREMRLLSRILIVCLCCAPALAAAAPVATTAGSNLTAYNPSNSYNNQWATVSNSRYDGNTSAKVDFGNCNAVILRCAQPKCANGGCTDDAIASAIVDGCVKANSKCKQYGDDLVQYMTAQLVASSNAKINEQQAAIATAQAQAEAQAAAAAAAAQSEQLSQMQSQMYQMQQQMAQQQQESAMALQEALAQQAAQSQAALDAMKSAATDAAQQTEAGITSYQQEAINRGISKEVLERQTITGQIQTEIEDAEVSLKAAKSAMQNSFNYAGCDARGNNCTGPKRIKKWRELATGFLEPYDNTIDKIYDALVTAQTVGVDLSQIYMMLNNSCNSWGQYLCPVGTVEYTSGTPKVCTGSECFQQCADAYTSKASLYQGNYEKYEACTKMCNKKCQDCTLLKVLNNSEDVYQGWIDAEETSKNQRTVVACASGALDGATIFARRTRNKNGAGLVDIDELDRWLYQSELSTSKAINADCNENNSKSGLCYCAADENGKKILEQAASKKSVKNLNNAPFCVKDLTGRDKDKKDDKDECTYISSVFGICDTHPFNAGETELSSNAEKQEEMKQIIRLKLTVISQQMYKQYEYLEATLRRLKIQLQKAVLTTNLEAAGAGSDDGASSGGGLAGGSSKNAQYTNCSGKDREGTLYCLRTNYSALSERINNKKCASAEKKQLETDIQIINSLTKAAVYTYDSKQDCAGNLQTYNSGLIGLQDEIEDREFKRRGWNRD